VTGGSTVQIYAVLPISAVRGVVILVLVEVRGWNRREPECVGTRTVIDIGVGIATTKGYYMDVATSPNVNLQLRNAERAQSTVAFGDRRGTAITAEGLVKVYKSRSGEVRALDGLDLTAAPERRRPSASSRPCCGPTAARLPSLATMSSARRTRFVR
jgi:hypothetical protein